MTQKCHLFTSCAGAGIGLHKWRKHRGGEKSSNGPAGDTFGHHQKGPIPNAEACLRALAQLAGFVALGVLTPAQANSIRASYREILQFHLKSQSRDPKGLSNADVLELMRTDPRILSMLEPILTEEQIAMVMNGAKGDRGG